MPIRNLTILLLTVLVSIVCRVEAGRNRYSAELSEAIDIISEYYVEEVDPRDLFEGGVDGMLQKLDPYSSFISPEEYRQFEEEIRQEFGGIGIEVGLQDGRLTVLTPLPDTPAYNAGILAGDVILEIDGHDTDGFDMQDAVRLIKGEPGTTVTLKVLHVGATKPETIEVERAVIRVESVRGDRRQPNGDWVFTLKDHPEIGYVRISTFAENTADELRSLLPQLNKEVEGLIIDLRLNPGGLLDVGIDTCDLFLEKGQTIVTIRGRGGVLLESFASTHDPLCRPNLPIVVLVDNYSASASEIFAACMQDHERATIVGRRTYGKGTVQNVIKMEGGKSAIRLTTATFWRPSGKNIHRHKNATEEDQWGVMPNPEDRIDITDEEYTKIIEQRMKKDILNPDASNETLPDPFLQRAIDVLKDKSQAKSSNAAA